MAKKTWIVTTGSDRAIQDIARDLRKAGFAVEQVNDEIQSIVGTASDDAVEKMRSVAGVVDVAPDSPVDIGPPGSDTTW